MAECKHKTGVDKDGKCLNCGEAVDPDERDIKELIEIYRKAKADPKKKNIFDDLLGRKTS